MTTLFLDCLVYNYMAWPPEHMMEEANLLESVLREATTAKSLLVVGSLSLLEEIMRAAKSKPQKYSRMISLFWDLIDYHLLQPWRLRLLEELRCGMEIPTSRLYVDKSTVDNGRNRTKSVPEVEAFLKERSQDDAEKEWEPVFAAFRNAIMRTPESDIKDKMESLLDRFPELVQACFERFCKDSGISPKKLDVLTLPCTHAFLAYNLMRFYERGRYGKEYKPSDGRDASYFVDATTCTHLVTDDKRFRETCGRVPGRKFGLMTTQELAAAVGNTE